MYYKHEIDFFRFFVFGVFIDKTNKNETKTIEWIFFTKDWSNIDRAEYKYIPFSVWKEVFDIQILIWNEIIWFEIN